MNGTEIALIITAIGTLVAALGSVIVGIRNTRIAISNTRAIQQVHESTNGKMDRLLQVTGAAEKAKGVQEGIEMGRGETGR